MNTSQNNTAIQIKAVRLINGNTKENAQLFHVTLHNDHSLFVSNQEGARYRDEVLAFDGTFEQELSDAEILSRAKTQKIDEVRSQKTALQYSNITYNDNELFATERARDNLFKAFILLQKPTDTQDWLDTSYNPVSLTKSNMGAIVQLLMSRDSDIYMREAELIKEIQNSSTLEDLNNIVVEYE